MHAAQPLDPRLDSRLLDYSKRSPNSYEAVWTIQRLAHLIPIYTHSLSDIYGRVGIGEARKAWGRMADICAGITNLPATMESLLKLKMDEAANVGHLLEPPAVLSLAGSSVFTRLKLSPARMGDLNGVIAAADLHDRIAKPLLATLRDELRTIDIEALAAGEGREVRPRSFGELLRVLSASPTEFPMWDGRPMFLDEQRIFLEYMSYHAAAEIVADHLVDEELGMALLYAAGCLRLDSSLNKLSLEPTRVPHAMLTKPVSFICYQIGDVVLEALGQRGHAIDPFERLFITERAVLERFDLDISPGLAFNRTLLMEQSLEMIEDRIVDLRPKKIRKRVDATVFEFREFDSDV